LRFELIPSSHGQKAEGGEKGKAKEDEEGGFWFHAFFLLIDSAGINPLLNT
jgi:hypothetical protein